MRTLTALLTAAMFASLAGVSPAMAQEHPEEIDETEVYQQEDHERFGIEEPGLESGFGLMYRKLPSTPGGQPTVAITWDDGSSALTHKVLDVAAKYNNVVLTFFVNNREPIAGTFQRILDEGHGIASHGSNHVALTGRSCSSVRQQILGVEPFVNARIDVPISIRVYRPPFGATNDSVRSCMAGAGYEEATWSKDTRDWTYPGVAAILRELESMVDGDIILLHDSPGKEASVEAFRIFLERHHDKYNFVMVPSSGFHDPCETGSFDDVCIEDTFFEAIEWMKETGMTKGCDAEGARFCPDDPVTRSQMAAFLVRGLGLPAYDGPDRFTDDNGNMFEDAIEQLAQAGVTHGCNPPDNTKFCPDKKVTRGQMAAFLVRALKLSDDDGGNLFADDNDSVFEPAIDRLGASGITKGCDAEGIRFCPDDPVTRSQMAAFLKRALN